MSGAQAVSFTVIGDPRGTFIDCTSSPGDTLGVLRDPRPNVKIEMRDLGVITSGSGSAVSVRDSQPSTTAVSLALANVRFIRTDTSQLFSHVPNVRWESAGNLTIDDAIVARSANDSCAPNCLNCTTSPTTCGVCAEGYYDPPECEALCDSPGCEICLAPHVCSSCDPAYLGVECDECNPDIVAFGSWYPNCVEKRSTDSMSTGICMALLLLLCVLVTVASICKPLHVFYAGRQAITVHGQEIPLDIDFTMSSRRLELTLTPQLRIEGASLEGAGLLPGAVVFRSPSLADPYTAVIVMTQRQAEHYLSRQMRVEVTIQSNGRLETVAHVLAIPLRFTWANFLAIFTIVLDFIQLSAFGFGPSVQWWRDDPLPHALRFSLLLPNAPDLWLDVFWIFVVCAFVWVLIVISLKCGCSRRMNRCDWMFNRIYGFLMPIIGQTLYLPIVSTMLSVFSCSRPITATNGVYVPSFASYTYEQSIVCWEGRHWIYVSFAVVVLLVYYPLAVYTSPLWQSTNFNLDVRYFPTFLILSGQIKFVLSVTSQFFDTIPLLLAILLIILPLPVVVLTIRRSPGIINALHWPVVASYMSVTWSGIASTVALYQPNVWFSSAILYSGWGVLLLAAIIMAKRKPSSAAGRKAMIDADMARLAAAEPEGPEPEPRPIPLVAFVGEPAAPVEARVPVPVDEPLPAYAEAEERSAPPAAGSREVETGVPGPEESERSGGIPEYDPPPFTDPDTAHDVARETVDDETATRQAAEL